MAESADSLFRRGMISSRQAGKLGVLKQTKAQNANMEPFDNKAGRRDQGGRTDRGTAEAKTGHINRARTQRMDDAISKRPTKGGRVNKTGQFKTNQVDDAEFQKPDFPAGASGRKVSGAFSPAPANKLAAKPDLAGSNSKGSWGTPKRAKGGNPKSSGPQYGGPNSRAYG